MNNESTTPVIADHPFERAQLGIAPFKFVGSEVVLFQAAPGEPTKPGSCCDYCFTSIKTVCWIRDVNGKKFKVGIECVKKTGDRKLMATVQKAAREATKKATHARQDAKIMGARELARNLEAVLVALPHPTAYQAAKGLTAWDYIDWMFTNAGRKGQCEVAKFLETIQK